jgi:hypothetical protein
MNFQKGSVLIPVSFNLDHLNFKKTASLKEIQDWVSRAHYCEPSINQVNE